MKYKSNRRVAGALTVIALLAGLLVGSFALPGAAAGTFKDTAGSVHEQNIEWLAGTGITRGCNPPANDLFCPDDPVTRGQMAAFLSRALDLDPASKDYFSDDNGTTFEADNNKLAESGVTKGCTDTAFCPDDVVTRGQMAAFLVRAFGYTQDSGKDFTDDDNSIFEKDIQKLATVGVTKGCNPPENTQFCPDDPVTRAQMATFLARAFGQDSTGGGGGGGSTTTITIVNGWKLSTIDTRSGAGRASSVVNLGGFASIAYHLDVANDMAFARCTNELCTSKVVTNFPTTPLDGRTPSMVVIGGNPVVAYQTIGASAELTLKRCSDTDCASSTDGTLATSAANPSMVVFNNRPAMTYYRNTQLRLLICTNASCSGYVDQTLATGIGTSTDLTVVGSRLVASYYDTATGNLMAAVCSADSTCTSFTTRTIASAGDVGSWNSVATIGGVPVFAYRDDTNTALKVAVCDNATCSTGATARTIDNAGNVGDYVSMTVGDDGFAWIAYHDVTNASLKFADCADATCSVKTAKTIDDVNDTGKHTSIANVAGHPVITYLDDTFDELRMARQ